MKISKFIYLLLTSFLIIGSLSAQTPKWVSTEVQKRNVVLEHFTGIGVWFPHGDRKAIELTQFYPNKIIIINNYCGIFGSYSQEIDHLILTTDEGDCIWDEISMQKNDFYKEVTLGYPEGSINRSQIPWSISYMEWETPAINIMKENSAVNIYVKPSIDFATRELTVEVEYYYTFDSKASVNFLSVVLLQNEIVGFMDNAKANPEYAINDSLYRHMHVLRKEITSSGAWGEPITTTTKGSYGLKKYTMILPDSIKNVPLDITKLEVAAFISENTGNIYTGHNAVIEVSEDIRTDLAVEDITEYNNNLIFEPIHPKIKVTNKSELPVTKFDIGYTLSNTYNIFGHYGYHKIYDTVLTQIERYSGTLNKGESVILEFSEITQSDFKSAFNCITTSVSNIYSNDVSLVDLEITDNMYETDKICLIDTLFNETEITFESTDTISNTGSLPVHTVFDYSLNSFFFIDHRTGADNTKKAAVFLLGSKYKSAFKPSGYIMLGEIDCKDNPNKVLSYYYAYSDGQKHGTSPRIVVDISKDQGKTWERISANICQETGEAEGFEKIYIPTSEEYKYVQINLYDYVKENFLLRIGCIPGTNGEALWIDEISIKNADNESIDENTKLSVYPNPVSNILHINNNNLLGEEYEIYDMSGELIIKDINNSNIINVGNLSAGTYSLKIKSSVFNFIKKQ